LKSNKKTIKSNGLITRTKNPDGTDILITPYSRMTELQIHVKGYTIEGKLIQAQYGTGPTTLFVDLRSKLNLRLKNVEELKGRAKLIQEGFMTVQCLK
jgi:hypothetical protein